MGVWGYDLLTLSGFLHWVSHLKYKSKSKSKYLMVCGRVRTPHDDRALHVTLDAPGAHLSLGCAPGAS